MADPQTDKSTNVRSPDSRLPALPPEERVGVRGSPPDAGAAPLPLRIAFGALGAIAPNLAGRAGAPSPEEVAVEGDGTACSPRRAWRPRPRPEVGLFVVMQLRRDAVAATSTPAQDGRKLRNRSNADRRSAPATHGSAPQIDAHCGERWCRTQPGRGMPGRHPQPAATAYCAGRTWSARCRIRVLG